MYCVIMGLMIMSVLTRVHQNAAQHPMCDELYIIGTVTESGEQCIIHVNVVPLDGAQRVVIKTFGGNNAYYELEHAVLSTLNQRQDPHGSDTWLPRLYPSCIMPGKTYPSLVMEFVQNPFDFPYTTPLKELVDVFHQLLWAVERLHQLGYSHNDLTVDNLRITNTGQVKFVDFGMAKDMTEAIDEGGAYVTGVHMPPEITRWKIENYFNEVTVEFQMPITPIDVRRLDSWSLGIIAFYILTGRDIYNKVELSEMEICLFDGSETEEYSNMKKYGRYFYIKETIMQQFGRTAQELEIAEHYVIIDDCLHNFGHVDTVQNRFMIQLRQRLASVEPFHPNLTSSVDNQRLLWTLVSSLLQFDNSARETVRGALENPIFQSFIEQAVLQLRNNVFT